MLIIPALGRWNQVVNTWTLQPASEACLASFGQMKDCLRQRGKWLLRSSSQGFSLTSNCTRECMPSLPHTYTSRRIQGKTNRWRKKRMRKLFPGWIVMFSEGFGAGSVIFTCPENQGCRSSHSGIVTWFYSVVCKAEYTTPPRETTEWNFQNCDTWLLTLA